MSRSIDERIVEMRFDNKQFEGGIRESLTSLSKLEEVLNKNISANSLDNINRAANEVNFSGLIKSVETISERFSTLGIVGMRVIENITDGLMNSLGKAISSVTNSIVSGGIKRAMNIENAHFQLQGLIDDETQVQAIMKQASDSVDGTAYSYDAAAKAASMFTEVFRQHFLGASSTLLVWIGGSTPLLCLEGGSEEHTSELQSRE